MKQRYNLLIILFFPWLIPLAAENRHAQDTMFDCELNDLYNQSYDRGIYLGKDVSNISEVVRYISDLDENKNSILYVLRQHIDKGFLFGEWDAVAYALDYAELFLKEHYKTLPKKIVKRLSIELD